MDIPGYDAVAYYATPPNSYIGTTIFLSYIVAALYATITITYSLYSQYTFTFRTSSTADNEKLDAAKAARARHIKIYAKSAPIRYCKDAHVHLTRADPTHLLRGLTFPHPAASLISGYSSHISCKRRD
ncbi:unnamed protein product [Alternaria alternata]